jgi:hypothetical protein
MAKGSVGSVGLISSSHGGETERLQGHRSWIGAFRAALGSV